MTLTPPADDPVATLVAFLLIFLVVGVFFLFIHLVMGSFIRPRIPDAEKLTIYECGEPTVGSAWVQFDLRYYVVALLFVIFDVEVAFFFPWATVFGTANQLGKLPPPPETREMTVAQKKELENTPVEQERQRLSTGLLPSGVSKKVKEQQHLATYTRESTDKGAVEREQAAKIAPDVARAWAELIFWDILVFFGVLMVGFAYLWRRGDIDWVRTVTHRGGEHPVGTEDVEESKSVA